MATNGNDRLNANRYGQTATWDALGGVDTLYIDGRARDAFSYTQDSSGAIHVDSISGASHEYHFTLVNVEKVQIGRKVVDLQLLFPLDTDAPVVTAFNPSDNATNVAASTDILITFNEVITRGSGVIELTNEAGTIIESYFASVSSNLSINGATLTINPTTDLALSTNYTLTFANGSLQDEAGNNYAGGNTYSFTTAATNIISGTTGNDTIINSVGDDTIDGGQGRDTVNFTGASSAFTIAQSGSGFTVTGSDGNDTLSNVERLHFDDKNIALDIDGNAGLAYRIYKAAFDRIPDNGGLGFWMNALDNGISLLEVAAGFTNSTEFTKLYGENNTNDDFVTQLYFNVLHRAGDAGGFAFWLGALDTGAATREQVLIDFSESPENQANVIELIGNGIEYTPFL